MQLNGKARHAKHPGVSEVKLHHILFSVKQPRDKSLNEYNANHQLRAIASLYLKLPRHKALCAARHAQGDLMLRSSNSFCVVFMHPLERCPRNRILLAEESA